MVTRPRINQWGATDQEHHATWPGDQLVTRPSYSWVLMNAWYAISNVLGDWAFPLLVTEVILQGRKIVGAQGRTEPGI